MTPLEKDIMSLTKDVAVIVNIQKNCQKSQARTTANVDKLVTSVETLSHDTVYLQSLVTRISLVEESVKWLQRTMVTTGLGIITTGVWLLVGYAVP